MTLTLCDASTEKALVRCALTETTLFGNTIKPGDIFTPELRAVWQALRLAQQTAISEAQRAQKVTGHHV